jgi:hypothetical protein
MLPSEQTKPDGDSATSPGLPVPIAEQGQAGRCRADEAREDLRRRFAEWYATWLPCFPYGFVEFQVDDVARYIYVSPAQLERLTRPAPGQPKEGH